jgi:two-component system invasion response regulator UvrY
MEIFHIIIADAREEIIQKLRDLITGVEGVEIAGEARSGVEVLELVQRYPVDLLIIGWQSQGISGPQIANLLSELREPVQVLFWGVEPETTRLTPRENLNVRGYLTEDTNPEEIQALIRQIRDEGNLSRYIR